MWMILLHLHVNLDAYDDDNGTSGPISKKLGM